MKATASFSYDRYIAGESSSLARDLRRAFNDIGAAFGNSSKDGSTTYGDNDRLSALQTVTMTRGTNAMNSDRASIDTSMLGNVSTLAGANLGSGMTIV